MYLFSPYDVERVYGMPFADISVTEKYYEMVDDARIKKTKIKAREFFQTLAEIQFESGYPYIMFEDTVNRGQPDRRQDHHVQPVLGDPAGLHADDVRRGPVATTRSARTSPATSGSLNIAKPWTRRTSARRSRRRSGR